MARRRHGAGRAAAARAPASGRPPRGSFEPAPDAVVPRPAGRAPWHPRASAAAQARKHLLSCGQDDRCKCHIAVGNQRAVFTGD